MLYSNPHEISKSEQTLLRDCTTQTIHNAALLPKAAAPKHVLEYLCLLRHQSANWQRLMLSLTQATKKHPSAVLSFITTIYVHIFIPIKSSKVENF